MEPGTISAIADTFTALFSGGLLLVAAVQLRAIAKQAKESAFESRQWATLQVCDRYDRDPIISASVRRFKAAASGAEVFEDRRIIEDATTVFNYFDSICIGVEQGLYVPEIVRDHLLNIMKRRREDLERITPLADFRTNLEQHYVCFCNVYGNWTRNGKSVEFRSR